MKTKGKRVLKNGAIGAYVYYSKEKKWKWRIVGRSKQKGGLRNTPENRQRFRRALNRFIRRVNIRVAVTETARMKQPVRNVFVQHLREGLTLLDAGNLDQAVNQVRTALQIYSDNKGARWVNKTNIQNMQRALTDIMNKVPRERRHIRAQVVGIANNNNNNANNTNNGNNDNGHVNNGRGRGNNGRGRGNNGRNRNYNPNVNEVNDDIFLNNMSNHHNNIGFFGRNYSKTLDLRRLTVTGFIGDPSASGLIIKCRYRGRDVMLKLALLTRYNPNEFVEEFMRTKLAKIILDRCGTDNVSAPDVYAHGTIPNKDGFMDKIVEYLQTNPGLTALEKMNNQYKGNLYKFGLFRRNDVLKYRGAWSEYNDAIIRTYNEGTLSFIVMEELRDIISARSVQGLNSNTPNRAGLGPIINKIRDALMCLNTGVEHNGRWISIRHLDLHALNILLSGNTQIVYVIDWGKLSNDVAFQNIAITPNPNVRNSTIVYSTERPTNKKHWWITSKYSPNNARGVKR